MEINVSQQKSILLNEENDYNNNKWSK